MRDLLHHQIVEMRVKPVDRPVDADGDVRFVHLVQQCAQRCRYQMGRPPRHALAHEPDVHAVLFGRVFQSQFLQDLPAVRVDAGIVRFDFGHVFRVEAASGEEEVGTFAAE